MKKKFGTIIGCVALGVGAATAGTWPTFHGPNTLDGVADCTVPDKPVLLWKFKAGSSVSSTPVADAERFYVATGAGEVIAIGRGGQKVWSRTFTEKQADGKEHAVAFTAPLLCAADRIVAITAGGLVHALAAADGKTLWTYDAAEVVQGTPVMATTTGACRIAILTQPAGVMHAVDAATGKPAWTNAGGARSDGHLSIGFGGSLLHGSCAAAVHAISPKDGTETSSVPSGEGHEIAGGVAASGPDAFTGTRSGNLLAVSIRDSKELWRYTDAKGELFSTPAVSTGRVVFVTGEGNLVCVQRKDGVKVWSFNASAASTSPVIAGTRVVAALDGSLHIFDLATGKDLWSQKTGDGCSSPAVVDGMIVVGVEDGTVQAFGTRQKSE